MRLPGTTRAVDSERRPWTGARSIPVFGASGGAGASTLCALLAGAIAERCQAPDRSVLVVDGKGDASPWASWLCRGLDTAADTGRPDRGGVIRGLDGVAVIPNAQPLGFAIDDYPVGVLDLPLRSGAPWGVDGQALLAVLGTADGIAAAVRAVNVLTGLGMAAGRIQPVLVEPFGGATRRTAGLLSLMNPDVPAPLRVPHEPAISRRGLAEAIACGAIRTPTVRAIRALAAHLDTPATAHVRVPLQAVAVTTMEGIPA